MLYITCKHMYGSILWINRVVRLDLNRKYSNKSTKKLLEFLATMPKCHTGRITEAQKQRQQIAKKSEKYGPSTVYLQVLGSGARGVPNTLYLFTDQKRYLFNCGECTQRLAHEHKVKLSRLEHIFITNKTWKNIGGLPGLSLTLQDVGVPNITLHGPEGLDELYKATKRFVIMKEMNVKMAKCTPAADFEDNAMTVKYVLLGPNEILNTEPAPAAKKAKREVNQPEAQFEEFINDDTDYYRRDGKGSGKRNNTNVKPNEKDAIKDKTEKVLQDLQKPAESCVAYICTIKKRLGTLDLEKCVERGVKPGPLLGQLKSGQDVVLPDGTVVRSADVKTPDDPGPVFIVLEVPDISYLREEEFAAHFDDGANPAENVPALVAHCTPQHVIDHPRYQSFMSMFGDTTQHLVLNAANSCLGSEAMHRSQHKLHLLDEHIFPLLRDNSIPAMWTPADTSALTKENELEDLKNKIALAQFQSIARSEAPERAGRGGRGVLAGRTLAAYHLRPRREWDTSAEPKLLIQDYIQEAMGVEGFSSSLQQFRQLVDGIRAGRPRREYPRVVFAGTGSSIPSKTRNTSGIVLQIDESRSMLLDCGEGTFGQLVRFYGPARVNAFLRTLRGVYVSHLHADHHIGLIGVLQARREAFLEVGEEVPPLYLLAPGQIMSWLSVYDQQFERIRADFELIPNQNLLDLQTFDTSASTLTPARLAALGLRRAVTCQVAHCPNAFGVALHLPDHKITYSGDTIPCEELVYIGKDSTLLIHEATMEDELAQEARVKMHSTTSQAIEVGRRMRASFTLLTHFSQRYARLPRISQDVLADSCNVGIAFDHMQVSMSDLDILPHLYAPLQLMFAEHCVELELKAAQRARRQERRNSSPNVSPDRSTFRCLSPSSSTKSGARFVSYKDSHASKLRYELKRNRSEDVTSVRSKSYSPAKYSARLCCPIPQSSVDIQRSTVSRPASPNINYVKLNYRPRSSGSNGRPTNTDKSSIGVPRNGVNTRDFRNTTLASSSNAKNKTYENPVNRRHSLGRQSRQLTKMDTQRRPIPSPSPIRVWKAFTAPILHSGRVAAPNAVPGVGNFNMDSRPNSSRSPSPLKRRSVSHNRSPLGKKIRDVSASRPRSVSRSRTGKEIANENSVQHELKVYKDEFDSYKKKQTVCRNENLPCFFTKNYSRKSQSAFRPQLEDIKSSFLIINENKLK